MGPRNHVLDAIQICRGERAIVGVGHPIKGIMTGCLLRPAPIGGRILMICASHDVFPRKEVAFLGCVHTVPHIGWKSFKNPTFRA